MGKPPDKSGYYAMSRPEVERIQVQCYSGHTYAERPDSFIYYGEAFTVKKVEREWLEPGERRFLVRTGDSKSFELCYNEQIDEWSLRELG